MKLWQKDSSSLKEVELFTVGRDRDMDLFLAPFDVIGSIAHVSMLESIGLLQAAEREVLVSELKKIYEKIQSGGFVIEEDVEDIHSQIELLLTRKLGDVGKKIHSGRSRNDQVLLDMKLFMRSEIKVLVELAQSLFDLLLSQADKNKQHLLPGYTHFQIAMPSSFGLWFSAYAESLVDDLITLHGAYRVVNKNPLGSAAGYGSSFPLNRKMTTELLGFDDLNYNVVYAQMGRGKSERIVAAAISNLAATLSKLSMDACLFMNQNFGFISFPDELTTGSSIMPHKKNPDVFELIRGRCNQIGGLPNDVTLLTSNLPSGYHRDMQLLKELLFPALRSLKDCLVIMHKMISNIVVRENILDDERYQLLFSVEEVNRLVLQGVPFRDAYKTVGKQIEQGEFTTNRSLQHTHEGSIGNLCLEQIRTQMNDVLLAFNFEKTDRAIAALVS